MGSGGYSDREWVDACAESLVLLAVAEELTPGPDLGTACAEIAELPLDAEGQVRLAALWVKQETYTGVQRMRSQLAAVELETETARSAERRGLLRRSVIAELAVTTAQSEASINRQVSDAVEITQCLPVMTEALEAGRLTLPHGRTLASVLIGVPADIAAQVEAHVVPLAIDRPLTPHQLRQTATRLLLKLDPGGCAERAAQRKRTEADVTYRTLGDGLAQLTAYGDDVQLRQAMDVIDANAAALADRIVGDDEDAAKHVGVRRAAALIRLILGDEQATRPKVEVLVTMSATALLGLCDTPAIVSGVGPVPARVARLLAADASWRRLITDPQSGRAIDLGMRSYVPSAALKRFVRAKHGSCGFPGCSRDAIYCDLDHRLNYGEPAGRTDRCNLGPLCRHHHNLKTFGLWTVERHPDGRETWSSPHGVSRVTEPIDYREVLGGLSPPVEIPDDADLDYLQWLASFSVPADDLDVTPSWMLAA